MKTFLRIYNALVRRLYYRNPLNLYLGQKLCGNDSGLLANLVGNLAHKKDIVSSDIGPLTSSDFKEEVNHFRTKGWVKLNGIDFGDTLSLVKEKFDLYCKKNSTPDSQRLEVTTINNSEHFFNEFPEVKKVLNEKIKSFITQFYQSHFTVLNVHVYRIFPVPKELAKNASYRPYGATDCWHNDGSTVETIKLFILIEDVEEFNGPLRIIDAEETKRIIRKKYFKFIHDGLPNKEIDKNDNVVKFTGKMGSVLLANTNTCLHRATQPDLGKSRDMLVFYLTSNSSPLPENWPQKANHCQTMGFSRLFNSFN